MRSGRAGPGRAPAGLARVAERLAAHPDRLPAHPGRDRPGRLRRPAERVELARARSWRRGVQLRPRTGRKSPACRLGRGTPLRTCRNSPGPTPPLRRPDPQAAQLRRSRCDVAKPSAHRPFPHRPGRTRSKLVAQASEADGIRNETRSTPGLNRARSRSRCGSEVTQRRGSGCPSRSHPAQWSQPGFLPPWEAGPYFVSCCAAPGSRRSELNRGQDCRPSAT